MKRKLKLNKIKPCDVAVVIFSIMMAIVTFIRIPFAFILGCILLMITVVYVLACMGLFDDDTEIE